MKTMIMSWGASIGVGVGTAILGALLGGWLATLAVDWYRVTGREGASGYFVLFQGLFAAVSGLVIGVVVSRYLAHDGAVPMLRAFGVAIVADALLIGLVAGLARWNADVPPTFEGERLMLAVELSWPEKEAPAFPTGDENPYIGLTAIRGSTLREGHIGALWTSDARHEQGKVIVPGAVEVWTERGKRILSVNTGTRGVETNLQVPLPSHPGATERQWSAWLPTLSGPEPAMLGGLRFRYRIVKRSEPVRTEQFGAFTVATMIHSMDKSQFVEERMTLVTKAEFKVTYNGAPVQVSGRVSERDLPEPGEESSDSVVHYEHINGVAVVPGAAPALLVLVDATFGAGYTYLLTADGPAVRTTYASYTSPGEPLASRLASADSSPATAPRLPDGSMLADRALLARPGLYVTRSSVLDTRTLQMHRVPLMRAETDVDRKQPLSLSPDEQRFVRIVWGDPRPVLTEVTIATGATRDVLIPDAAAPTGSWADVDGAWFDRFFAWKSDASGASRVTARP